jgi:Sulfatase
MENYARAGSNGVLLDTSLTQISVASDGPNPDRAHTRPSRTVLLVAVRALFFLATRVAFLAFWLVTLTYCTLAYVPFAYFGFIQSPLLTWIPLFVTHYAGLYTVSLGVVIVTLIPYLDQAKTQKSTAGFMVLNGMACCYLWRHQALATLHPEAASYLWGLLSLYPLTWLALLDMNAADRRSPAKTSATLGPANVTLTALMVSLGFAIAAMIRAAMGKSAVPGALTFRGLGTSLSFHLVIFLAFALILEGLRWVSEKTPQPRSCYRALAVTFVWLLGTQTLRVLVFPTISFEGLGATILAASAAFAIVLYVTAGVTRVRSLAAPLGGSGETTPRWIWPLSFALVACAYSIPMLIGRVDWDFVLEKVATIVVWVLMLQGVAWSRINMRGRLTTFTVFLLGGVAAGGYEYVRLKLDNPGTQAVWTSALDAYSGADISFKTAYSILSPSFDNRRYQDFYRFLKQRTNLGREASVGPADTRLVTSLQASGGPAPNIFLFVIDSLRRDSVSPYNAAVDYTPEIGRFAQDSLVMQNAYTRYGGTALSEPAIWVGAMQLHKQYIEPFYPMNNLEHLLEVDGYQSYISFDPILRTIVSPSPSITELESDTTWWGDLDFVRTLKKLEIAMDARVDRKRPIFAYSQPQNIHTLTLERSRIQGGRKAVTAYEMRRMDAAFGEFLRFLEQRGLYDNSIIILTADHGDSYGEFGRYGHSNFLFPEVIRIPLIIHLPPKMRHGLVWDTQQVSFTTDITPTLYYLLGHRPILNNELLGRPLLTQTWQEQTEYTRPYYLLVSSYGPVYAILGNSGKSLFIVDAVDGRNYFYDLAEDPLGSRNHVTARVVGENAPLIRRELESIDGFYGWSPPQNGR